MQYYLVQHGEARLETEDPARPLTQRGRQEVQRVARQAAALALPLVEIRHSGKLRAQQTAAILGEQLSPACGIREMDGLAPMDDPAKAQNVLETIGHPLMVVGHLPHLSRLASSLLVGDPGKEIVQFRMGAIVCLAKTGGGWRLQWILTPELARELA